MHILLHQYILGFVSNNIMHQVHHLMQLVELDQVQTEVKLVKFQFLLKTELQYHQLFLYLLITIVTVLFEQLAKSSYVLILSLIHI